MSGFRNLADFENYCVRVGAPQPGPIGLGMIVALLALWVVTH